MFKLFTLSIIIIISIGCGDTTLNNGTIRLNNTNVAKQSNNTNALSILNKIRLSVNLNQLKLNNTLMFSSQKHSNYLNSNKATGHTEQTNGINFYETTAQRRTSKAGYLSSVVSENVSVGQDNIQESIDGLMSAIYHRFGFLAFNIDELGYGKKNESYTYNMGNSHLNALCNTSSPFTSSGKYYYEVCKNAGLKIQASTYDGKKNIIINSNPSYVLYPNKNGTNIQPVFYEETPDPLPNYSVSGYPISIQFNPNKVQTSSLVVNSFTLKDSNNKLLDSIILMDKNNDYNNKFTAGQFALFPKNRLEYDSKYTANINYSQAGTNKQISWSFRTKKLNQTLHRITASQSIQIQSNQEYALYIVPKNANDILGGIKYEYSAGMSILKSDFIDQNTYAIKVSGTKGQKIVITLTDSIVVTLIIT